MEHKTLTPSRSSAFVYRLSRLPEEAILVISFVVLIALGTVLLLLPGSTHSVGLSLVDAVFTATSAVCVTGLAVVDTGSYFSRFGQTVILLLIQLGGLGIITLSTFAAIVLGKRIPLKQREIVRQTHSSLSPQSFKRLVIRIILFTLTIEAIGAALLFARWNDRFPVREALFQAVFHSVSAFCNAGFSLFPASLIDFQGDYAVNFVVMSLIFLGGIGFLVIYDVERTLLFGDRLSLHSELALRTSLALIIVGTLLFLLLEYHNVLAGHTLGDKLLISLFQAVTPRTAGFNSIDFAHLSNSSLILILFLMFIGGSPGSAAGGIKTTTFAVFMATGINRFKGRTYTNILRRTVPEKVVNGAISIILVSVGIIIVFNFTLQWSENGAAPHDQERIEFLETNFEIVSAFATVGLSTGVTSQLSVWGRVQIILLMLVGRVGPLTVAFTIAKQYRTRVHYEFYRENVMVG